MQKKNYTKSWKQAVAEVVAKHEPRTVLEGLPDDKLTQEELRSICETYQRTYRDSRVVLLCNNKGLSLCLDDVFACRRGAKYFQKTDRVFVVRIFGNRLTVNHECFGTSNMRILFALFGVKDWRQIPRTEENAHTVLVNPDEESGNLARILAHNTSLLKDVLTGRVWSDETLYKRMATVSYKQKKLSWKVLRSYLNETGNYNWICVSDLATFTPSVENSMRQWLSRTQDRGLMKDCVNDAILDGTTVDLKRSARRLNEDHLLSVRTRMKNNIARKEQTPLFETCPDENGIHLLNSELEVYVEGLEMGHCIYTHYFQDIKKHRYLGFSMNTPERCTFGVSRQKVDGKTSLHLDQIRLHHNATPSAESRAKAEAFVEEHSSALLNLFVPMPSDAFCDLPDNGLF